MKTPLCNLVTYDIGRSKLKFNEESIEGSFKTSHTTLTSDATVLFGEKLDGWTFGTPFDFEMLLRRCQQLLLVLLKTLEKTG